MVGATRSSGLNPLDASKHKSTSPDEAASKDIVSWPIYLFFSRTLLYSSFVMTSWLHTRRSAAMARSPFWLGYCRLWSLDKMVLWVAARALMCFLILVSWCSRPLAVLQNQSARMLLRLCGGAHHQGELLLEVLGQQGQQRREMERGCWLAKWAPLACAHQQECRGALRWHLRIPSGRYLTTIRRLVWGIMKPPCTELSLFLLKWIESE